MKARLVALLALVFLTAQFFAAAHGAAYGDADHVHDGHPCIVASMVKKSSDMDVASAPHFDLAEKGFWIEASPLQSAPKGRLTTTGSIRAPPSHA